MSIWQFFSNNLIRTSLGCCFTVAKSFSTLSDPMEYNTPGFSVLHYLPEFAQTHVHQVGDAIQPSRPLLSRSPTFNLSQHQDLFQWVHFSHQVAKILELQLQPQSFRWVPLGLTGLISLQSKGLSRVVFKTTVQKHQFFGTLPSLWSNSLIHTWWWLQEKPSVQFITQLCPTLCSPMDCSTPGFPVHHQLPKFTQTHVHWVMSL